MRSLSDRFALLGVDSAPGQTAPPAVTVPDGGRVVDFSHGDLDAFPPPPGAFRAFTEAVEEGAAQAYTPYKGRVALLEDLAPRLAGFTGAPVDPQRELIITPGTQGALFLALASTIDHGDRVAIMDPDYFANRKIVEFLDARPVRIPLHFTDMEEPARPDLEALGAAFADGVRLLVLSNPNNPTGALYTREDLVAITALAERYGAMVVVDQLYSRQVFDGRKMTHLRALDVDPDRVLTLLGPSKTESMSGFRLGVAVGSPRLIERMERLQAIVSLRAPGYNQAVLRCWFNEPDGWMAERIAAHQAIRDDLVSIFTQAGWHVRPAEAGSYLFPQVPGGLEPGRRNRGGPRADGKALGEQAVGEQAPVTPVLQALRTHAGVIVTPGSEFTPTPEGRVRLNFSQDHQAAAAAARRMVEVAARFV